MLSEIQKKVLIQIAKTFKENNISFKITGGLAAIVYGAKRKLFDIDIEVLKKYIQKIRKLFKKYITEDIHHLQNERFDIYVMSLDINGVVIDISQVEESYVIDKNGNKIGGENSLNKAKLMKIDRIEVPIEDKDELIKYKKILNRDTDLIDIEQMTKRYEVKNLT